MLRLHRSESTQVSPTVTTAPVMTEPPISLPASGPIEAYLDQVEAAWRGLPETYRREMRQELRLHLESMVAAYLELGDTPEQAVSAALERFGDARMQGRALRRELQGAVLCKDRRAATVYAIRLFGGRAFLDVVIATVLICASAAPNVFQTFYPWWVAFCIGWLAFGSPCLAGWKLGRETGPQAFRATAVALPLTMSCLLVTAGVVKLFLLVGIEFFAGGRGVLDALCDGLFWAGSLYHVVRVPMAFLGVWAGRRSRRPILPTRVD